MYEIMLKFDMNRSFVGSYVDDISDHMFFIENWFILIHISLKLLQMSPIGNNQNEN